MLETRKETTMSHHEKCAADEMFVGNTMGNTVKSHLREVESVRIGKVAYDIHGRIMRDDLYFPVFINKRDAGKYDRIMTGRMESH